MEEERKDRCGAWGPIIDIKDPHLDAIPKFAISEHNKQRNSKLKFQTVVSGESQVVSGMNFRLVIDVTDGDGGGSETYVAKVFEKAWLDFRVLKSFKPAK